MELLFGRLNEEKRAALAALAACVEACFPLPARFAARLPADIAALSRLLTSARSERDGGYLSGGRALSAYLRYFLPWNVYKLCVLFSGDAAPVLCPPVRDGVVCADLGSGTLAVPIALWICFPALRKVRLTFYCVDKNARALDAGQAVFAALAQKTEGAGAGCWDIRLVKNEISRFRGAGDGGLDFVYAFNVYNEIYAPIKQGDAGALALFAGKTARTLCALLRAGGRVCVAEPGVPAAGQFLSRLRGAFIEGGCELRLPCPHRLVCPAAGGRRGKKWCHFVFGTEDAPASLHALSQKARLSKEKITLSFMLAEKPAGAASKTAVPEGAGGVLRLRALSAPVALSGGKRGVYACSRAGLALVCGDSDFCRAFVPGALLTCPSPAEKVRDSKSGALLVAAQ
ncbi:MAG: small ribosomal subunit Rsm22 family protein [Spirochaetaceae bacterium]|nr:small ribosomal subunit Rsm22 family protein [Spirochaetaceae bacterium]